MSPTEARLKILDKFAQKVDSVSDAILLTGSLAYGENYSVREDSDIDVLLVTEDYNKVLELNFPKVAGMKVPDYYFFEAMCLNDEIDDVKISVHIMPLKTLNFVASSYVSDIRVYRPQGKNSSYKLRNFLGADYKFDIKNVELPGLGYRTIVPVGFHSNDSNAYHLGIYRDKLLCHPKVVKDPNSLLRQVIDTNWETSIDIFGIERNRLGTEAEFVKGLVKYDRFSPDARSYVQTKTGQ
jgi:predicted nucleotidyltransferase